MSRRPTKNKTNIKRLKDVPNHDAWVFFECLKCSTINHINVEKNLLHPDDAYQNASWKCRNCGFLHNKNSDLPETNNKGKKLPFKDWGKKITSSESIATQRFWKSFFTVATENREVYWKQCNVCGRILPAHTFSGHKKWGPLEKQMECRNCKSVINANLNPKRTKEQLHESSVKRRIADLLPEGENEKSNYKDLFKRFNSKCFKTGKKLDINDRDSWRVDHILPSKYLYPLTITNTALLSKDANANKSDRWPSKYFTNNELKKLSSITGANLSLISRKTPIINSKINVDKCVSRMLTVRSKTDISKRIDDLKKLLENNELVDKLSKRNRQILGLD